MQQEATGSEEIVPRTLKGRIYPTDRQPPIASLRQQKQASSKMLEYSENRKIERHPYEGAIIFSYFNLQKYFSGKSRNYSKEGICIQSNIPIKPGSSIYFRWQQDRGGDSKHTKFHEGFRTVGIADVKWCKEITSSTRIQFLIGAKYHCSL